MLEKMGWSKGKGLGKNEDGMQEHIKTPHHFNTEGKILANWLVIGW